MFDKRNENYVQSYDAIVEKTWRKLGVGCCRKEMTDDR